MEALAYVYVLGVGPITVLALLGHFGFGIGTEPRGFNYTRLVAFTLLWFVALPVWSITRLVGRND